MNADTADAHAPSSTRASLGKGGTILLLLVLLAFSMAFQGSRGIWEPDEGRYTNIALRMLQTGDYLVPSFNDDTVHFAKPPLTYWAVAGGMALLGRNEWGARLPNALAFAATVLVVLGLARRMLPGRAWLPPLVYATCIFPFGAANIVTTDTLLTLWEALAVLGFVAWRAWHLPRDAVQRCAALVVAAVAVQVAGPVLHNNYMLWWLPALAAVAALPMAAALSGPLRDRPGVLPAALV